MRWRMKKARQGCEGRCHSLSVFIPRGSSDDNRMSEMAHFWVPGHGDWINNGIPCRKRVGMDKAGDGVEAQLCCSWGKYQEETLMRGDQRWLHKALKQCQIERVQWLARTYRKRKTTEMKWPSIALA
jgi:hypothetical protein